MFTGIVEELGTVRAVGPGRLDVGCATVLAGTRTGDSVSVNGCCLTVTALDADGFRADLMGETLARTALGDLVPGAAVNLERAMAADGRFGGHLVQGHVDAVAAIIAVEPHGTGGEIGAGTSWTTVTYALPPALACYVVEKGSITVDGTSLTVMAVDGERFSVGLIPHTMAVTTHGSRRPGDRVNLEVDVIAKYVQRQLTRSN